MTGYERYRVPLLDCFREAFLNNDSRKEKPSRRVDRGNSSAGTPFQKEEPDGRPLSAEASTARRGLTEAEVRASVTENLVNIVNTIDMQSSEDITDLSYVSRSILNYGIYDLTHLTSNDAAPEEIERNIVSAIVQYEPRIRRDSVDVRHILEFNETSQKLKLSISAEISFHPLDVPIDIVTEVDLSSSKVAIVKAP